MAINKEVNAQLIFPQSSEGLIGIQIENRELSLSDLTEIAFFALDSGYKLSITNKSGISYTYSTNALKNHLNNQNHHEWRGKVIEEMRKGSVITLADPLWKPLS